MKWFRGVRRLNKKILSQIPMREAKEDYVWIAKGNKDVKYLVSAEVEKESKTLLLYLYDQGELKAGNKEAAFRIFISKDDYITQEFDSKRKSEAKWRTACMRNLIGSGWYGWASKCMIADQETSKAILDYLKVEDDPLGAIDSLQEEIMAKRLEDKHKATKERIDRQMKMFPKLPKGFEEWIDKTALYKSRYIFYIYSPKKEMEGYCTNCKTEVLVEDAKHNLEGECPSCKSHIIYKATGMSKNIVDYGQASLIQRVKGNIITRYFSIKKSYRGDYRKPNLQITELAREVYDKKGKPKLYEYDNFKQTNEVRWCDRGQRFNFYDAVLYERNLNRMLKGTLWEYSALKEFATHEKGFGFNLPSYLIRYLEIPLIEYLVKSKLYRLTDGIVHYSYMRNDINLKGRTPEQVLEMNKEQIRIAQRINANADEIKVIRETGKEGLNLTDEQTRFISENLSTERVVEMAKYTTAHKMIKYINDQNLCPEDQEDTSHSVRNVFNDWYDYVRDCETLNYDLKNDFVLFPRNLREAHDRTYKLVAENKKKAYNEAIKAMSQEVSKTYNWKYKNYKIIAPKTAEDITQEGHNLKHCVGNYIDRVANGETIVLFLRDISNLSEPYFTIEIDPTSKSVLQCRGKNNCSMTDDVEKIMEVYKKEKLEPLAYEEVA